MFRDRDFDPKDGLPPNTGDLIRDLELNTLFDALAMGDEFLLEVAKHGILSSLCEPEAIRYRQHVLTDCLDHSDIVRDMYAITVEAVERRRKIWGFANYPEGLVRRAVEALNLFVELLKKLKRAADEHGARFRSEGFTRLFTMLARELDDEYLNTIEDHLRRLEFRNGVLLSAGLGEGNKGSHYVLRKPWDRQQGWKERLQSWVEELPFRGLPSNVYEVADRDETGFKTLAELRDRGISHVAKALAQSSDHIESFLSMLRLELGFYICCLNLHDRLSQKGEQICLPEPVTACTQAFACRGLYDVGLSLSIAERTVGNDLRGDGKALVMITGANRGGKSTFLRSVGLAQLMMQCGMFVPAQSFRANVRDGIFTHFKREEDATMKSGKLDEELSRMSSVVDKLTTNSIILCNESFASTNEREGSEIARQIVRALLETGIKVFYVTHMFDLAQSFYTANMDIALFLRAERLADGQRTFRLVEGEPLPTSYGEDLYGRIFEAAGAASPEVTVPT
jgi:MutS domain V